MDPVPPQQASDGGASMSPKKLGRYELIRVLGRGAMGLVYKARDPSLDRMVAIKTISIEQLSAAAAADYELRFRNEARSAGRLQHANIVSVYDAGRDGDTAFLVMELVDGKDLKHYLDNGERYSLAQSLAVMEDLLAALSCAHGQNVIHRDVKPANLLVEPGGRVKLTDFGVARIQDSGDATRKEGTMVGTLKYMSPEQVKGLAIDARADIFAAGVVLYQLLTGHRPFTGATDFEIIQQIVGREPIPVTTRNASLPAALDRVVSKALTKACDQRFQTAAEFSAALLAACQDAADLAAMPALSGFAAGIWTGTLLGDEGLIGLDTNTNTNKNAHIRSPNTVAQELELVYWKDVRQSCEARDLQLFIEKFPTGIYIDLALRRLQTLQAAFQPVSAADDPQLLSRQPGVSRAIDEADRWGDATLVLADSRSGPVHAVAAERTSSFVTAARPDSATVSTCIAAPTVPLLICPAPEPAPLGVVSQAEPVPVSVEGRPPPAPVRERLAMPYEAARAFASAGFEAKPRTDLARGRRPVARPGARAPWAWLASRRQFWLIGVVAVGVAGAVFGVQRLLTPHLSQVNATVAMSALPALTASGAAALDTAVPVRPTDTVSAAGAGPAAGAKAGSPSPRSAAPAASGPRGGARVTLAAASRTGATPVSPERQDEPSVAGVLTPPLAPPAPALVQVAANPRTACENRVLLGFQFCMAEQCGKPAFAGHPVCQERGAMEERRREAEHMRR